VVSIPSEGFKSWYGHFEGIFSCCYATEGELTFIARKALLNVLVLGGRETDRGMKHCVTLRVSDMPLNADTLRDDGVRESTEAGEKRMHGPSARQVELIFGRQLKSTGPKGDRYQVEITLVSEKVHVGPMKGSIVIDTNDSEFPRVIVPVRGQIVER